MTKGDFDYVRAWSQLARPAYDLLSTDAKALYARVARGCGDCRQDSTLDTVWPAGDLRESFETVGDGDLAFAARVVNFVGHWLPGGERNPEPNDHGAHWKFANYCDQVLRDRCGLAAREHGHGQHFAIHEGLLRLCHSTRDSWTWSEVGIATPHFLERARAAIVGLDHESAVRALKRLPDRDGGHESLLRFMALDEFKERGPEEVAIDDALAGSGLRRVDIRAVNFRPHPFVITARHLEKSSGGILDPGAAPCGHRGCRLSYDEHAHDLALFVAGARAGDEGKITLTDDQQRTLKALVPILSGHKIAGVAFVGEED